MTLALIVEFSTSHAECLEMPCTALRLAGMEVRLLVHPELRERVRTLDPNPLMLPIGSNRVRETFAVPAAVLATVRKLQPTVVIFNTASGIHVRHTLIALARRVRTVLQLHDVRRLERSRVQRFLARRADARMVLAPRLATAASRLLGCTVGYAYPLAATMPQQSATSADGRLRLAVVGQIDTQRRTYTALLQALAELPSSVRVAILGKPVGASGQAVLEQIRRLDPSKTRIYAPGTFISDAELQQEISCTDALLPLIEGHARYRLHAVSGTHGISMGQGIPMLASEYLGESDVDQMTLMPQPGQSFTAMIRALVENRSPLVQIRREWPVWYRAWHQRSQRAWQEAAGLS